VPGVLIVMPRLIYFLLPTNTDELKKRFSRFAIFQTLFMVLVMSFTGAFLSTRTGLNSPLLEGLLQGKASFSSFFPILLPTFLYSLFGLIIFCGLYYGIVSSILDEHSFQIMTKLRRSLGVDGCVLYGGVTEEVIGRWGLVNLVTFFALIFARQINSFIIIIALIFSALIFAIGQIPAYIVAGCISSRRCIYSIVVLSFWQSLIFGFLFWQYGLVSSILGHMMFHIGWAKYDKMRFGNK
jgi:hypothetical protein